MKYEYTTIHVIEEGIDGEFLIQFSYNPETDKEPIIHAAKGRMFILHGISYNEIIYYAMMQNNIVRALDGEIDSEIKPEDNHIYFDINDYALIKSYQNGYFKDNLNYEPNKELKTR